MRDTNGKNKSQIIQKQAPQKICSGMKVSFEGAYG